MRASSSSASSPSAGATSSQPETGSEGQRTAQQNQDHEQVVLLVNQRMDQALGERRARNALLLPPSREALAAQSLTIASFSSSLAELSRDGQIRRETS